MKKEDITGLVMYLVILAVALVYGLVVLQPYFAHSTFKTGFIYALFILGAVAIGVLSASVLFEVGHILGAFAGKYTILSVCILHLLFFKEDGKLKAKFGPFDGLTGETKVLPKSEKSNPRPYLLLGTLFNSLWLVGCIIIFYFNKDFVKTARSDMAYFFLSIGVVVGICLFYNIVPFRLDSINDGYRLSMVSNPRNKEAFNELLRVEYEISKGNKDVEIKTFTELTNFTAELNMSKVYVLLDNKKYQEADEMLDIVLKNKETVSFKIYLRAISMKVFVHVVSSSLEDARKYIEENIDLQKRRDISDDNSLISIRAYVLITGLVDNSRSECMLALNKVYRAYKATPKNRRGAELNYFNQAIDIVNELHPKWEVDKYRLVDEKVAPTKNEPQVEEQKEENPEQK